MKMQKKLIQNMYLDISYIFDKQLSSFYYSHQNKIYYYYCPKLSGNLCSDYENRPDICKDFPHNPLKLLPSKCSFNDWKNEIAHEAMLLKAKVDIIEFYKEKLQ